MKLEKIEQSTLAKTIFATLAISAVVGAMVIFPSFGYIVKYFTNDKKHKDYVKRIFRRLEKQELIAISEKPNGEVTITLTEKGRQKALIYQIEKMNIKKPKNWDRLWRVVIFDIPEGNKQARNLFRQKLKSLGFYPLQKSVFAHPFPCKDEVDFLKHNLAIANYVTFIEAKNIDNQNLLRNHFQV